MVAQNLRLLAENHLDGVTLSVTSEDSDYPIENLQVSRPTWRWRSTSASDQVITWSLAEEAAADMFALVNDNLTTDSTIQIELATDSGYTDLVYDETFSGRLPYYGLGEGPLGVWGLGGYGDYPEGVIPKLYHVFDEPAVYQYGRITISDSGNSDSYFEAGRIIVGYSWQPATNMNFGVSHNVEFNSNYFYSPAGGAIAEPSAPREVIDVSFSWLDEIEDKRLMRIIEQFGRQSAVLLACFPDQGGTLDQNYTVYGPLVSWSPSVRENTQFQTRSIRVSETR